MDVNCTLDDRPNAPVIGSIGPRNSQPNTSFRVAFYADPQALLHPGGGEVQLQKTAAYLKRLGVDVRIVDSEHAELAGFDRVHLFGTVPACLALARRACALGVPIALSTISWYDPWVNWNLEPTPWRKLRGVASWTVRRVAPSVPSWRRELMQRCDLLLPNSHAEARQLVDLFGFPESRIAVVPNGVDERFGHGDATLFERHYGLRDFIFVPGRIEPRKNQRDVLRALWGSGLPVVVLGDSHPDHASYMEQCRAEADSGTTFIGRLDHDSPLLAAAYAGARVVVLASWFETPGLAALEGALAGAQVVVTNRGCALEYFDSMARTVSPDDIWGIRQAVRDAFYQLRQRDLAAHVRQNYRWERVAEATLAAYRIASGCATPAARIVSRFAAAA